jgi:hypothetical protein
VGKVIPHLLKDNGNHIHIIQKSTVNYDCNLIRTMALEGCLFTRGFCSQIKAKKEEKKQ